MYLISMTFTGLDIKMLTFPDIFRFSNGCENPYFDVQTILYIIYLNYI